MAITGSTGDYDDKKRGIKSIGSEEQKQEIINKWSSILETHEKYESFNSPMILSCDPAFPTLLPISMKIAARTIAGDYDYESDERIKRRIRIQKLERILDKETFESVISKDEYDDIIVVKKDCHHDGLVPVLPMSAPSVNLMFVDFKYNCETEQEKAERIRKERNSKLKRLIQQ